MPSFFFHSDAGDGSFLARRLAREGHRVRMHITYPKARDVARGLVELVPRPSPARGDVIVFDSVHAGKTADAFRRQGFRVIGGSRFADSIELDRAAGMQLMQKAGIRTPETKIFKTYPEGVTFLKGQPQEEHWFFKPFGNIAACMTYDASIPRMLDHLAYCQENMEKPEGFLLQKKVEGVELSLEGWFDGDKWVLPFNSTIEDKHFLNGNLGPRTGCMANLVFAYSDSRPTLVSRTLARIEPTLRAQRYVGPIDLNMIIDKEGEPYGLEWTARFGYDALQGLCLLTAGDWGHQLADFANGRLESFNVDDSSYALTINTSVPPFPNTEYSESAKGKRLDPAILLDPIRVMPRDVMLVSGRPQIAGGDATVVTVGERGTDLWQLRRDVLGIAKQFEIQDLQYRTDPVTRAETVLAELKRLLYDTPNIRVDTERPSIPYEIKGTVPAPSRPDLGRSNGRPVVRREAARLQHDERPAETSAPFMEQ